MSRTRDFADLINGISAAKITSGTFADARLSSSSVTQHVDLTSLSADNLTSGTVPSARLSLGTSDIPSLATSKITSGTFADGRISSSSVTQHASSVTNTSGNWTPSASDGGFSGVSGRYHKTGNLCMCFAHGKFSSRTAANDNQFFINGLPFTSRNSGDIQGGGSINFNSLQSMNFDPVIAANESRIRIYTSASDVFTTNTKNNEYLSNIDRNMMITNRNMRQSSNNGSDDNFMLFIYYITA